MFLVYFMKIQILKSKLHRAKITDISTDDGGLEDVFLKLTKN